MPGGVRGEGPRGLSLSRLGKTMVISTDEYFLIKYGMMRRAIRCQATIQLTFGFIVKTSPSRAPFHWFGWPQRAWRIAAKLERGLYRWFRGHNHLLDIIFQRRRSDWDRDRRSRVHWSFSTRSLFACPCGSFPQEPIYLPRIHPRCCIH